MAEPRRERSPWWAWGCGDQMTARDRRNLARFNLWALGWMVVWTLVSMALGRGWLDAAPAARWAAALLPSALGLVACLAYWRFLRETDELQRKIQVEGLALAFGAGIVFMLGYRLAERAGAPEIEVSDPVPVMVVFWALGQWLATRRYR